VDSYAVAFQTYFGKAGLQRGIELCLEHKCYLSALTLIYTAIDNLAFLDMPESQQRVTGQDFIKWTDKYLSPERSLGCTASDLYSARCAIVHTLTTESIKVREETAHRLFYAWGTTPVIPKTGIDDLWPNEAIVMIKIEDLAQVLFRGMGQFWLDIVSNKEAYSRVFARLKKVLATVPFEQK